MIQEECESGYHAEGVDQLSFFYSLRKSEGICAKMKSCVCVHIGVCMWHFLQTWYLKRGNLNWSHILNVDWLYWLDDPYFFWSRSKVICMYYSNYSSIHSRPGFEWFQNLVKKKKTEQNLNSAQSYITLSGNIVSENEILKTKSLFSQSSWYHTCFLSSWGDTVTLTVCLVITSCIMKESNESWF